MEILAADVCRMAFDWPSKANDKLPFWRVNGFENAASGMSPSKIRKFLFIVFLYKMMFF